MKKFWEHMKKLLRMCCFRQWAMPMAVICILLETTGVGAFNISTGNDDIKLSWDNTVRYSYGYRVEGQNDDILRNPNSDDGDRNFDRGTVENRFDLLSEMKLTFKKDYGLRVSGSFFYDNAYESLDDTNVATSNRMENNKPVVGSLSDVAKRYSLGPNGELLDAFVFGKADLGDMPINARLGQTTVYWGESLLFGGAIHGISYSQSPLDINKALMQPGITAKELFLPMPQASFQAQPTKDITFLGQYFLAWNPYRYPETGTYLGFNDGLLGAGESLILGKNQRATRGDDSEPNAFNNVGIGTRYSSDWLDGTFGLYFRRYADMQPQAAVRPYVATLPAAVGDKLGYTRLAPAGTTPAPYAFSGATVPAIQAGLVGNYYECYAEDITTTGISFSKEVLGTSVGAEVSYRWNMPLSSRVVTILPPELLAMLSPAGQAPAGAIDYVPTNGEIPGARGNTWHGVFNVLGLINTTPVFDTASWNTEFVWNRLDSVTDNPAAFKGPYSNYNSIDKATMDYFGVAAGFTPTWYQVFPGWDITMPLSFGAGLSGNSAVLGGGNQGSGSAGAGFGFDFMTKYKFDVRYIAFYGQIGDDLTAKGALSAGLNDRDMVTFMFTTKF
jgi:hypothetical protein